MLNILQWQRQSISGQSTEDGDDSAERLVGIAASGLDLVARLLVRLQQDRADAASDYLLQSAVFPEAGLRPQNQRALALLRDWLAEPDNLGDAWWDEFERNMEQSRLTFREVA